MVPPSCAYCCQGTESPPASLHHLSLFLGLFIYSLSLCLFKKYLFLSYVHLCFDHGSQVPGTGIKDSCELPCGCGYWELNPGPLEEQSVFNQETISAARHGASLYIVLPGKHDLQSSQSSLCPLSKGVVLPFNV